MYNIIWYEGDGVCEGSLYSGSTSVLHTEGQGLIPLLSTQIILLFYIKLNLTTLKDLYLTCHIAWRPAMQTLPQNMSWDCITAIYLQCTRCNAYAHVFICACQICPNLAHSNGAVTIIHQPATFHDQANTTLLHIIWQICWLYSLRV